MSARKGGTGRAARAIGGAIMVVISSTSTAGQLSVYPEAEPDTEAALEMRLAWEPVRREAAPRRREARTITRLAGCASRRCDQRRVRDACSEIIAGVTDVFDPWETLPCGGWFDNGERAHAFSGDPGLIGSD